MSPALFPLLGICPRLIACNKIGACALAIILSLCSPGLLTGQMHNNTWVIGYKVGSGSSPEFGHSLLSFGDG